MNESDYYNGLNVFYRGDYQKLQRVWERFQNWEAAFNKEGPDLDPKKELEKLENLNTQLILKTDPEYPSLLKEIPFPPFGVYVLGDFRYDNPAPAIVGTRAATPQGKELAKMFAEKLGRAGITIVSGLAMGIDESAHRGALEAGGLPAGQAGKTIAVLGTPLNHIYPKQNETLAKEILKAGGAIISEFPFGQEYHPQNFLIRNRIISGLTKGTLVIEAPERSGALATARFALEQNREVFVVPGSPGNKNYRGSNELIKQGANLVTDPKDILDYFGIQEKEVAPTTARSDDVEENALLMALQNKKTECSAEELLQATDLEVGKLNQLLALLTIKGIIKEINGKYYLP